MKKLWVIGDSFSLGESLPEPGKIWPDIVSEALNYKLVNVAVGGVDNDHILSSMINVLPKVKKDDFVIIGLTNPLRYEIFDWNINRSMHIIPGSDFVQNGLSTHNGKHSPTYLGYTMFEQKGVLGPINRYKSKKNRETTLKYISLVRAEALDYLEERDWETAINFQKELSLRGVKSFLWSWHKDFYEKIKQDRCFHYDRIDDGHYSLKGHRSFAERALKQINNGVTAWENIYE
jgi:hypothetical protein|tara:strand:- start:722 stop:1420 length:699 start_codon:yes stop_codon:yes gene_type:complete